MREILLVSRWFYPADTSLHVWLTGCAILAVVAVLASWLFRGAWRKYFIYTTAVLACAGAIVSLAMIAVEAIVFAAGSLLCIAAYLALLITFVWFIRQSYSERPRPIQLAMSFLLASAAFIYLFPFGAIPPIVELEPKALESLEGTNILGRRSGTLLITEFADFECPACAMQDETMEKLWGTYPNSIRYSFRHMPLKSLHPHAQAAALASQCAAEQGRFWETKRLLFANYNQLKEILSHRVLPTIPPSDAEKYGQCVDTKSAWSEVSKDIQQAKRLGLRATPSIVVGNKLIAGMISYPRLALLVKHELDARNLLGSQQANTKTEAGCGSLPATGGCAE
jgi:protein-disulfide isomerase